MILPTHLVASQVFYYSACIIFSHAPTIPEAAIAAIGGMFPDIENRQSLVGRLVPTLSDYLEHEVGHRTLTHSALAQLFVGLLLFYFLPFGYGLAFMAGWISHTTIDMMTLSGIAYWYPSRVRCVMPAYAKYRFKVMSWAELIFCALMTIAVFPLHTMALSELGTTGLIRQSLGDFNAARETYNAERGDYAFKLEVIGKDNATLQNISGTYDVLRAFKETGFVVKNGTQEISVCKQTIGCKWYAKHGVLHRNGAKLQQKEGEKEELLKKWLD